MATKYRVNLSTYVVIEADTPDEARREITAIQEDLYSDSIEGDIIVNAQIESVEVEGQDLR